MTDETETQQPQKPLAVFTCINRRHESRSCYALIENTPEVRQKHRQWHVDQETDREALRGGIKARDETIALLRQEIAGYGRDVTAYGLEVASFHGEVQRVETPIVPPQLEIDRNGYSDDELDDEPDEPPVVFSREDLLSEIGTTLKQVGVADEDLDRARAGADTLSRAGHDDEDDDDLHTVSAPTWAR